MVKKKKNSLKLVFILGLLFLSIVLAKKEWRTRLLTELKQAKDSTEEAIEFIRDNREQIVEQVKTTAIEVSTVVRDISNDVKRLGETASHLKESSEEIVKATKEAAEEMKSLKKNLHNSSSIKTY
jgi:methyl-accepting chemotaxis protein